MVEDLMILGLWFGISFLIAKSYKKKQEKDIKIGITLEKKGKGNSTFKKIRFSLIMSIITFLIGIFFAYDLIGFPLKTKLIGLFVAFIPFMLFMIILIIIYVNKENQKIFSISKKISVVITYLLLFYYLIALFIIVLTESLNPMINPKYYNFYRPDLNVFPKKIPEDVEDVQFLYSPGILQGGKIYTLYYIDKDMSLNEFDKKYKKQAEWVGHLEDYKEKSGLLSGAFHLIPSEYENKNDYIIYLIKGKCDDSGYCNHGHYVLSAFNEKTHQVIYKAEYW